MGLFNKKGIWGGVLGPVGNSLGDIFDNGPSLLDKVNMLLTDVETEGKKQGYTRAAAEYEKAFRAIRESTIPSRSSLNIRRICMILILTL